MGVMTIKLFILVWVQKGIMVVVEPYFENFWIVSDFSLQVNNLKSFLGTSILLDKYRI